MSNEKVVLEPGEPTDKNVEVMIVFNDAGCLIVMILYYNYLIRNVKTYRYDHGHGSHVLSTS